MQNLKSRDAASSVAVALWATREYAALRTAKRLQKIAQPPHLR